MQVKVGAGVGVSSLCEKPLLPGPLSHVWVSTCIHLDRFFLSLSLSLYRCVSLSLSHYYLSMSLYISLSPLRASNVSEIKTETGAKLTGP